jgi:hypothetical protein
MAFERSLSKKALEKLTPAQIDIFYKSGRIINNVTAYNHNIKNKKYLNQWALDYYYTHKESILAKRKAKR